MTRADNTRFLAQATAERHQATLRKASDAIAAPATAQGQPVNFSAVAAAAGVSRTWLYRHDRHPRPDQPHTLRSHRSPRPRATAQRATTDSLRPRLDAARAEITRLRAENTTLRDQAARHLGEQRTASRP